MKKWMLFFVSILFFLTTSLGYNLTLQHGEESLVMTRSPGSEVTLEIKDVFYKAWQIISGDITITTENKFIMPEEDVVLKAVNEYTISYDANGGDGAPASQKKIHGTDFVTLSSTKPTRSGYEFSKWNTKADGSGMNYAPGAIYSANEEVTLYAQWLVDARTLFPEFSYVDSNGNVLAENVGYIIEKNDGKDGDIQNWRIKFLKSGTLTFTKVVDLIDIFCVGGGGGGSNAGTYGGAGGGGGGYTKTLSNYSVSTNTNYSITIGNGGGVGTNGGATTAFGVTANGGKGATDKNGAAGGSGGGGGGGNDDYSDTGIGGSGGSDGGPGGSGGYTGYAGSGGTGQTDTTREFGARVTKAYIVGSTAFAANWLSLTSGGQALTPVEGTIYSVMTTGNYWYRDFIWDGTKYKETDIAKVYAGGGGASGKVTSGTGGAGGGANSWVSANANTGGGGGARGGSGGSGIVVIRNSRVNSDLIPEFTYTGLYESTVDSMNDDGTANWRIKFLTDGTLKFTDLKNASNGIDIFCVGGGGGGSNTGTYGGAGGGGGGYTKTLSNYLISANTNYSITIGNGGSLGTDGGATTAFGVTADGGKGATDKNGAAGGSGGGGGGGNDDYSDTGIGGSGGSDGGSGGSGGYTGYAGIGGTGQTDTTREFGARVTKAYIVGSTAFASNWLSLTSGGQALTPAEGTIYSVMTTGDYWYRDFIWNGTKYKETDIAKVYAGGGGASGKVTSGTGGAGGGANSRVSANANTGGGGGARDGFGGSGIVVIRNAREKSARVSLGDITYINMTPTNIEADSTNLQFNCKDDVGQCEKINIAIIDLEIGQTYTLNFVESSSSTVEFLADYNYGCKVAENKITHISKIDGLEWTQNAKGTNRSGSLTFEATAETMYWIWDLSAMNDNVTYTISFNNISITEI